MNALLDFSDDERIGTVCWCGGCADDPCSIADHEVKKYTFGAAAAFGLIGMAEEIRRSYLCDLCGAHIGTDLQTRIWHGLSCCDD